MIAESIIAAAQNFNNIPIVVRLQGTNAVEGQKMVIQPFNIMKLRRRSLMLLDR